MRPAFTWAGRIFFAATRERGGFHAKTAKNAVGFIK